MLPLRFVTLALGSTLLILVSRRFTRNILVSQTSEAVISRSLSSDDACGFIGNSDVYGLGIRLGVYLQWLTSIISKRFFSSSSPEVLRELLDANAIFTLSILIGTALLATGSVGQVYGVEILIMLHIFFGSTYIISYDQLIRGPHSIAISFYGISSILTITCGMSAFATWYWFPGLDDLPDTTCGSFAFLFAKVALKGRARLFFKIAAIVNLLLWSSGFLLLFTYVYIPLSFGLISSPFLGLLAGFERLVDRFASDGPDIHVKRRDQAREHGRYVLAMIFGVLGKTEGHREDQGVFLESPRTRTWLGPAPKIFDSSDRPNPIA